MKLAKPIYNEEGQVLLAIRVELTDMLLSRLEQRGITVLYIEDSRTDDLIVSDVIEEETRRRALFEIRGHFRKLMEDAGRRKSLNTLYLGRDFRNLLSLIIDDLSRSQNAMVMLMDMQIVDHYLYRHSVNVCIYSTLLGMAYGYNRDELTTLGLGALLHDIGKTLVPQDVLLKPGKLTAEEFNEIQKHAELGFRILKDAPNIPLLSAHCALQHHERLDGTGYPRGIAEDEIHDFAKWLGIVDSYDAMTTSRVYRPAMLPHQALEILFAGAGKLYDLDKLTIFRNKVALYPIGMLVTLNTGEAGVVVDLNTAFPQRPIVRVLQHPNGEEVKAPYEIDLSKHLTVMIEQIHENPVQAFT